MIYGKVRIIKTDDTGEVVFDKEVCATCDDNQITLIEPINCLNGESLLIDFFKETDISIPIMVVKTFIIFNKSNTIKGVYLIGEDDASIH
jgi:hypothetical protein